MKNIFFTAQMHFHFYEAAHLTVKPHVRASYMFITMQYNAEVCHFQCYMEKSNIYQLCLLVAQLYKSSCWVKWLPAQSEYILLLYI